MERRLRLSPKLYDGLQKFVHGEYTELRSLLAEVFDFSSDERVLELGCGTGALSKLFRPGQYTGVDLDGARIAAARKRYPDHEFAQGDASSLSSEFLDRFAFVFCHAWIHHIDDESTTRIMNRMAEAARAGKRTIRVAVLEPILPRALQNPFGFALAKLDRGRYVRSFDAMKALLGPSVYATRFAKTVWYWPVPGAAFHLKLG